MTNAYALWLSSECMIGSNSCQERIRCNLNCACWVCQMLCDRDWQVVTALERVERGEPPSDEALAEWELLEAADDRAAASAKVRRPLHGRAGSGGP